MKIIGVNRTSCLFLSTCFFLLLILLFSPTGHAMTISGPITANNVTVTGDVTMSSMTVSSITVTNSMVVNGTTSGIPGRVLQMVWSSGTVTTTTTSGSWVAVSGIIQSMTLSNVNDYIRISLSGSLFTT